MTRHLGGRCRRDSFLVSILVAALAAPPAGCGGGGQDVVPPEVASVTGEVTSTGGAPLAGVRVSRVGGPDAADTDASGQVVLAVPTGREVVLRLSRSGFVERVEVLTLPERSSSGAFSAVLLPREAPIGIAAIQDGGSAAGKHGTRVTFPAGALVNAGGQPVSGDVAVTLTPFDISSGEAQAFPGPYQGIPQGGSRAPIVSFGAADFEVTQGGAPLRIASGRAATVEIPLYATRNQDGSLVAVGQRVPLWSLDAQAGIWRQEGEAEVVASAASPTGLAGRASVGHFSPWNLDQLADDRGPFQATPVKCVIGAGGGQPQRDLPAGTSCTVKYTVGAEGSPTEVRTEILPPAGKAGPLPSNVPLRLDGRARVGGVLLRGVLRVTLEVGGSGPLVIVLDPANAPPTANAGPDQAVPVGSTVQLDGAGSRDPDGDALTFSWSLTARPAGSTAALSDAAARSPTLVVDAVGSYLVRLVVNDGKLDSAPDTVRIMAEPLPSLSIGDAQVGEGDSGTSSLVFQVHLSRASAVPVKVDYATADGTATAPGDYAPSSGTLTIPPGTTAVPLAVAVVGDTAAEADETLTVTLANPSQATIADGQATGTIIDDDQLPVVTIVATLPNADESGEMLGAFTVTRTGPTAAALAVAFTAIGTATSGIDYVDLGASVTIPAGQASAPIAVRALGDGLVEGPETVVVTLASGAAYRLGTPASATVTIVDGSGPVVSVVATDPLAAESGPDTGRFTISRSGGIAAPLEVGFTVSGTATGGVDYLAIPATAAILAGQPAVDVVVTPIADHLVDGSETVVLTLLDGAAYDLGSATTATVTISDVALPEVTVAASDPQASEPGANIGAFTLTRTEPIASALDVNVAVGGSATAGADYQAIPATVAFPAGQATTILQVTPVDDSIVEGAETVVLTVSAGAGYTVGLPSSASVSIADDDLPVVTIVATDASAAEAGPDPGVFTISRTGPTAAGLRVTYSIGGTAQNGSDYQGITSAAVIPGGLGSVTVTITPIPDQVTETSETVVLILARDLTGTYQVGMPDRATVTILGDVPAAFGTPPDAGAVAGPDQ